MAIHRLYTISSAQDFQDLKSDIEKLLITSKQYTVKFESQQPSKEIFEDEDTVVINAEYGSVAQLLVSMTNDYSNFKFEKFNPTKASMINWMVISEDNSQ